MRERGEAMAVNVVQEVDHQKQRDTKGVCVILRDKGNAVDDQENGLRLVIAICT